MTGKSPRKYEKKEEKKETKKETIRNRTESICPTCGKDVPTHKCRFCGAVKTINSVSGNVIWMRNGRVVEAFTDERQAYIQMATKYRIPETKWPERFRKGGN